VSQHGTEAVEIHQTEEKVKVRELGPGGGVFEILPPQVDILGAIALLG